MPYCVSEFTGQKPVKIYHCAVLPCRTMCFRQEPSQHKMELLPCKDQRYNRPRCFLLDTLSWHLISKEKSTLKVRFPHCKVENILKVSLDSIPSPSPLVKIQIMGWKKNIVGPCKQTFEYKIFVDNAQQCFAFTPQANFPAHSLNFHWRWRWWDI